MNKYTIIYLTIAYFLFIIQAHFFADRVIYAPAISSYQDTALIIKLKTKDDTTISALYLANKNAKYTILFSHGNGEDLNYSIPFLQVWHDHGFSVFAYDYHGYGTSSGKPTEEHVYADVEAAYNYLVQNLHVPPEKIIAYGHSIGAAVNIELATHRPLAGLIVQSAFVDAFRVLTKIPLIPFPKYNNIKKIKQITCPILFIHGTHDEIVDFWHAEKLYKTYEGKKSFLWVEGAGHNDVMAIAKKSYWYAVEKFILDL
ncbi:MAG: hypothetical protein A2X78_02260 [Gammaproteobacteria bacterium GWE2_37_16]|nr:MAG: hypothetical protein A2X78_02260 [Gammaproteobacteria bacterium GWE2_37_16]